MFIRLTSRLRICTGWLIAFAYLLCVLAPDAALALGTGPAPCLGDDFSAVSAPMTHVHGGESPHDHGSMHMYHQADAAGTPARHDHDGKISWGPCCAMFCVSALPADLPLIVKPSPSTSRCVPVVYRRAPSTAPPLLYRPPIV